MLLAGDLAVKPTPLALIRIKREHALTAPLCPPGSHPWGSSCDQVASLFGLALSLPVTPAQERPLNCRDHRDLTGQTDLSWARDERAHFDTGGGHPSLRPGNSVPLAPSHAAQRPRGAWVNYLRPNSQLGSWTCNFCLPAAHPSAFANVTAHIANNGRTELTGSFARATI